MSAAPSRTETQQQQQSDLRVLPVAVDSLDYRAHDMDLYIWHDPGRGRPALYRGAGIDFTADDAARLKEQRITFLHIPVSQHGRYRTALHERLERRFNDKEQAREERARVIRAACSKMIEDVLLFPGQPEVVEAVREISVKFALWAKSDRDGFGYLLDMSAHDFYTTTHMVNVGVGCGLLMNELRPGDSAMMAVAHQGGLLHDLGKRGVPEAILNKEGKLEEAEWEAIKKHPSLGYEELKQMPGLPAEVLEMTRDHHERLDGNGYPAGRKGDDISFPARVCAVVDVYDAITAARPYRGPTPPQVALRMMKENAGTHFDREVLEAWEKMVNRMIEADPGRIKGVAEASGKGGAPATLDALLPTAAAAPAAPARSVAATPATDSSMREEEATGAPGGAGDGAERRRDERFDCDLPISGRFVRQLKVRHVADGERFALRLQDISRNGAMVRAPWPLAISEVLDLELPLKGGTRTQRARVMRVRQNEKREWVAGVKFVDTDTKAEGKAA